MDTGTSLSLRGGGGCNLVPTMPRCVGVWVFFGVGVGGWVGGCACVGTILCIHIHSDCL